MNKLLGICFLIAMFAAPVLAQQLNPGDQQRFDSYYSRWQQYRQQGNRDQMESMQKRMLDIYAHNGIPAQTPFWQVATNRRTERERWQRRLSPNEQARFDSYFERWQRYRQTYNRDQMASMEKRMQEIYAQNRIPSNTPYWWVASNAGESDH